MKRLFLWLLFVVTFLSACSATLPFVNDENGHKQYKDKNGNFVKNEWVKISNDEYFLDLNGYLLTDQWIEDKYYVDQSGKKQKNYWYNDKDGNQYYLDNEGKYARDCIITIEGKEYAFEENGQLVKDKALQKDGIAYFFNSTGKSDKEPGFKTKSNYSYYIKDDGTASINEWVQNNEKWYYCGEDGKILINTFIDDYFVDENGEMVIDKVLEINGEKVKFDKDGKVIRKKISFREIAKKYCISRFTGQPTVNYYDYGLIKIDDDNYFELDGIGGRLLSKGLILEWVEKINAELGIPKNVTSRMKNATESDGTITEKYGSITVSWKVASKYEMVSGTKKWVDRIWVLYTK